MSCKTIILLIHKLLSALFRLKRNTRLRLIRKSNHRPFFDLFSIYFPVFILNFSFAIFEQTLSFLIEEFDFYAIAYASNDFSIKRFLIAFFKMTFFFLFLSVLRLKSRNKDQPGDVKNGG